LQNPHCLLGLDEIHFDKRRYKKEIYLPILATIQVKRSEEVVFSGCGLKLLPENVLFLNQPILLQSFDPGSIMDWIYQYLIVWGCRLFPKYALLPLHGFEVTVAILNDFLILK